MHSQDDIHYALETTKVLREPDRRIDTFGETRFEFQLISELMDRSGEVRIRTGEVEAMRPRILRPTAYNEVEKDLIHLLELVLINSSPSSVTRVRTSRSFNTVFSSSGGKCMRKSFTTPWTRCVNG